VVSALTEAALAVAGPASGLAPAVINVAPRRDPHLRGHLKRAGRGEKACEDEGNGQRRAPPAALGHVPR
jgi:hypothetical protein